MWLKKLSNFGIDFRPSPLPVLWIKNCPRNSAIGRLFNTYAVFWIWLSARVTMTPLANLSVRLNDVPELAHSLAELRYGRRAGLREVLVKVHVRILVAFATGCKEHLLCVAHATLLI